MTIFTTIKKANKNLFRTKFRTFLTILSVFIGALCLSLVIALNTGFNQWIDNQFAGTDVGAISLSKEDLLDFSGIFDSRVEEYNETKTTDSFGQLLTQEDVDKIKKVKNVQDVIDPDQYFNLKLLYSQYQDSKKISNPSIIPILPAANLELYAGELPSYNSTGSVVLSFEVAKALGFENPEDLLDKTIQKTFENEDKKEITEDFKVVGILRNNLFYNDSNYLSMTDIKRLYEKTTSTQTQEINQNKDAFILYIIYEKGLSQEELDKVVKDVTDLGFSARFLSEQIDFLKGILNVMSGALLAFAIIALFTAFFGVVNTLITSTLERTREIGLMRALGESKGGIFRMFAVEAGLIGFWGSITGIIATVIISQVINYIASEQQVFGFEDGSVMIIDFVNSLIVVGIITIITLIAGLIPAIKAANTDPVNSLKYE
jgi:putative ABC transport system permease protein